MKYIDADLLRKDIDHWKEAMTDAVDEYSDGVRFALKHFTFVLDSLQQEQPEKSKKDCNDCPHCVDRKDQYGWHFKGCFGGPYNGKFIAEIDECPLKQEQHDVDLEMDAVQFCFDKGLNARKEESK